MLDPNLMVQEELERRELEMYEERLQADIEAHERSISDFEEEGRDAGCFCEMCA